MLCKGRKDTLVRYALAGAPAPLVVADYTTELAAALEQPTSPADFGGHLHGDGGDDARA